MEDPSPNTFGTEPVPVAPPPHSTLSRIFVGPHGLRAGWRLLIYLALTIIISSAIGFLLHGIHIRFAPLRPILVDGAIFAAMVAASLIMGHFEHRSMGTYGLPARGAFGSRFWEGAVWGFVALSVVLLCIAATGDMSFGSIAIHGKRLVEYAVGWGVAFLLVGFAEEYMMRGYAQYTLTTGMGFWPTAVILSVVFAAMHAGNPGETIPGLTGVVLIALFFCLTLRRTGDLWFAIGFHAAWDWAETFFYGVPDSGLMPSGHFLSPRFQGSKWITGGTVGPEGSIFSLLLIGVITLLLHFRFPNAMYPRAEFVPPPIVPPIVPIDLSTAQDRTIEPQDRTIVRSDELKSGH